MRAFFLQLVWGLLSIPVWGQEIAPPAIHFGGPPPGYAFIELETQPRVSKPQIAGSLAPLTFRLNGNDFSLTVWTDDTLCKTESPFVSVNGRLQKTVGASHSFFFEPSDSDMNEDLLRVVLKTSDGRCLGTQIQLESFFLERPIRQRIEVLERVPQTTYDFELGGLLDEDLQLEIPGMHDVRRNGKNIHFKVRIALGRSFLDAKILRKGTVVRRLALPVTVSRRGDADFYFSVFQLRRVKDELRWDLERKGGRLLGLAHPDAVLKIGGRRVPIDPNGDFEFFLRPLESDFTVELEIEKGAEKLHRSMQVHCLDCEWSWKSPKPYSPGSPFVEVRLLGYSVINEFGTGSFSGESGLGAGIHLGPTLVAQVFYRDASSHRQFRAPNAYSALHNGQFLGVGFSSMSFEPVCVGMGLAYLGAAYNEYGYSGNSGWQSHGHLYVLGAYFQAEARFAVTRHFEIVPRLTWMPPLTQFRKSRKSLAYFAFDLFGLRYHF